MYICIYVNVCIYSYACLHIHIIIYLHTYTHAYTCIRKTMQRFWLVFLGENETLRRLKDLLKEAKQNQNRRCEVAHTLSYSVKALLLFFIAQRVKSRECRKLFFAMESGASLGWLVSADM